ncbi:hypothetical protein CBS14141_004158 [Malassezia furfur]|nr:hypothetical protein CBS14141_004158 [Malassezia furfur]
MSGARTSTTAALPVRSEAPMMRPPPPSAAPAAPTTNGVPQRHIPSPPPQSGSWTFPTSSAFPPPRSFPRTTHQYPSGAKTGTSMQLSHLA